MIGVYELKLGVCFHPKRYCEGQICAVHNPSKKNPMRDWKFEVRLDKGGLVERFCPHGIGHTDPDSLKWLKRYETKKNANAMAIHGCDGCCHPQM